MCDYKCIHTYTDLYAYKLHLLYTYVGLGEYHLRATCKSIQLDLEDLELISTRSPGDIVKHLRVKNPDDAATNVTAENFDDGSERLNIDSQPVTMLSRARALVEENKISFNPQMHVFNVQGTHDVRVVSLYPKEKCSCPSNGFCYHILGVKISLGAKESGKSNERNLSQLRKNTRPKNDKKSGRKRPRTNDVKDEDAIGISVYVKLFVLKIFLKFM